MSPSPPETTIPEGSTDRAGGVASSGRTSPLERAKQEALRIAGEHHPAAERLTPQMVASEICVHVWDDDGVGTLVHTGVFV